METMFCNQCQETAHGSGCSVRGVCGKEPTTAALHDVYIYVLKSVAKLNQCLRKRNLPTNDDADFMVMNGLFMTITNVNFDNRRFVSEIRKALNLRDELKKSVSVKCLEPRDAFEWAGNSIDDFLEKAKSVGVKSYGEGNVLSLRLLLLYGLKGMAAYAMHADNLGYRNREIFDFMQQALSSMLDEQTEDELYGLVMKCGEVGVQTMALLDQANCESFGEPEISRVNIGVRNHSAILVTGHDFKDLDELLQQAENAGVDVYTHGEMLPAHYYPHFKQYSNLVGNYGGAWFQQVKDFETFNGPILFTTNCLVPPRPNATYANRVFTTGPVGCPDFHHIKDGKRQKDFSEIISMAKNCPPPQEIEKGEIVGGFAHNQVYLLADKIVEAVKAGKIRKFVVMAGCDGRMTSRDYYTKFAEGLPKDTVILTAGCAKYRYNKLNLGEIAGIPRVLDAGQCNDSYSLMMTALMLRDAFKMNDLNELPIVFNIAWYEQKAVLVLLALLSLGVKNIHLGPTLPAFLSQPVVDALVEKFSLGGITNPADDLKTIIG